MEHQSVSCEFLARRVLPAKIGIQTKPAIRELLTVVDTVERAGAPPGIRTRNLRIKSPLLCH